MFNSITRAFSVRIAHPLLRLSLAALIGFWPPFVQAAEPSFDALSHLLHAYAGPVDEKAAEAAAEDTPPESGARLAKIQSDLSLLAEGFEAFRHPGHARHALKDLPDHLVPELRPFFTDRDSTLDTVYRTLAVTDYTWALRFPEPNCDPLQRRRILLSSKDGLFTDPKSGELSPWLARLLGPAAHGRTAEEALDRASSRQALTAGDYELLRVKVARITEALTSDKAVGKERSKLYCLRADVYETLASAHRAAQDEPIQASRGTAAADLNGKETGSVLLLALEEGPDRFRAVGAGVMVETPQGPKVLTDARLMPAEGEDKPSLRGFARAKDGTLNRPRAFVVERVDHASGVMVGRLQGEGDIPALKIAQGPAARRDLFRAIGHMSASGAWTISQGLVTETGEGTFSSDAILGPDMLGSPLLNDAGEVVGLVVLSPGAGAPVAVQAEHLRRVADGDLPPAKDLEFLASRQTGSASLLTTAMPLIGELRAAGGGAIEAGLPNSLGGVNWSGGGGVGNWRPRSSAGPPSGYSRSYSAPSSSYGSGKSAGTEIGEALAPLVEALIFKGIPALFRGIGSLFKSKPRALPPRIIPEKPIAIVQEKPPEPLRIECRFDKVDVPDAVGTGIVALKVRFSCDDQASETKVPRAGHKVSFSLGWEGRKPQYEVLEKTTDAQGYASITFYQQNPIANAERSFEALDKYDPDMRHPAGRATELAHEGALINAANSGAVQEPAKEAPSKADPPNALALIGPPAAVRSIARLTLSNASAAAGGTIGEIAITGAASIGIIVAGGAVVIFTVKNGLADMIAAQDRYNQAIDTRKPTQDKFDALAKESAKSREAEEDCALKPGEDISVRFVDRTGLAAGFLRRHENRGGHTIERHVGKPIQYLIERLREIRDASSYNDLLTAENVTRRTILSARREIEAWLARAVNDDLAVRNPGGPELAAIGYAVSRGNHNPTPKYDAAVILRKVPQCEILILTSYPE